MGKNLLLGVLLLGACSQEPTEVSRPVETVQPINYAIPEVPVIPMPEPQNTINEDTIEERVNIPYNSNVNRALVLCDNFDEYISVRDSIRPRGDTNVKMQFNRKKHTGTGTIYGVPVDVAIKGENDVPANKKYDIIALRGHYCAMYPLIEEAQKYQSQNPLYLLGGCWTAYKVSDKLEELGIPIIGNIGMGDSFNNSYILRQTLKNIKSSNSWDELRTKIERSSKFVTNSVYFPGEEKVNSLEGLGDLSRSPGYFSCGE